jgi:long-chain fatty acid transport protein
LVVALIGFGAPAWAQAGPASTGLTASADNATTAFFNPAGLTRLDQTEIVVDLVFAYAPSHFKLKSGTTATGSPPADDSGDDFLLVPSFYLSKPISKRWRFGFSVTIPMGMGADYGDNWAGRYITQESSLVFVSLTPVVAYKANSWFSIGGGPLITYTQSYSKAAVNNLPEGLPDGRIEYEADGVGVGFIVGTLFEFSPRTRLGVNYRSESEPQLETMPKFENIGPVRILALLNAGVLGKEINADLKAPQTLQLGLYHELTDKLALVADGIWIDFDQFGIEQVSVGGNSMSFSSNYKDMWAGSVGVKYRLSNKWSTALGSMYLSEGVEDEHRTLGFPLDRIFGFGVGIERRFGSNSTFQANLNYYDTGEKKIDTEPTPLSGRIVGEYDDNYAITLDIAYILRF